MKDPGKMTDEEASQFIKDKLEEEDISDQQGSVVTLDCGCVIRVLEKVGHKLIFELNFEKCIHHKCDDSCRSKDTGAMYA